MPTLSVLTKPVGRKDAGRRSCSPCFGSGSPWQNPWGARTPAVRPWRRRCRRRPRSPRCRHVSDRHRRGQCREEGV